VASPAENSPAKIDEKSLCFLKLPEKVTDFESARKSDRF
jgi:hypothetical protein